MPRIFLLRFWLTALLLLAPGLLSAQTQPATSSNRVIGRIIAAKVVGNVTVTDTRDPMRPRKLSEHDELTRGQLINTGDDSRVLLVFSNGATVNLAAKSTFLIDEFLQDPFSSTVKASELVDEPTTSVTKLTLIRGELMSNVKHLRQDKGSTFSVQTPVGAAGIRGTTFQILYRPTGSVASYALRMVEGKINQDFGGRARALDVVKDQQIALEGLALDAAGRLVSLPADIKVTEIPANIKAALALVQQQLLEAAAAVSFPAMTQSVPPQEAYPQSGGSSSDGSGTTGGPGGSNATASPLSPVPPALAPPPRTTPGDGKP